MQNINQNDLFLEIEEDLQRQRFEALWNRFGPVILTVAALIVLGTALISGYKSYRQNNAYRSSAALQAVLKDTEKKPAADAMAALAAYDAEYKGTNQAVLARFYAAARAGGDNQKKKALDIYDGIAADKDAAPVYRDMGTILYVLNDMDEGEIAVLQAKLFPLLTDSPWRFMAKELTGHLQLKAGDKEKAKQTFVDLINAKDVPMGIGQRAAEMLQWLSGEP